MIKFKVRGFAAFLAIILLLVSNTSGATAATAKKVTADYGKQTMTVVHLQTDVYGIL